MEKPTIIVAPNRSLVSTGNIAIKIAGAGILGLLGIGLVSLITYIAKKVYNILKENRPLSGSERDEVEDAFKRVSYIKYLVKKYINDEKMDDEEKSNLEKLFNELPRDKEKLKQVITDTIDPELLSYFILLEAKQEDFDKVGKIGSLEGKQKVNMDDLAKVVIERLSEKEKPKEEKKETE